MMPDNNLLYQLCLHQLLPLLTFLQLVHYSTMMPHEEVFCLTVKCNS